MAKPIQWEYLRVSVQPRDLERRLNAQGHDGWELVTANQNGCPDDPWICIFKREAE